MAIIVRSGYTPVRMPGISVIGIDLGGTKAVIARYDAKTLKREAEERIATHAERGFAQVVDDLVHVIDKLRTSRTKGVGIGAPGLIHQPDGVVLTLPNIPGGRNMPLKKSLEERLALPVTVDNDANCFALAEAHLGAGKGKSVVVGITMGTGVGGGIVIDGKIIRGHNGYAAEVGHMLLVPGHPPYRTDDKRGEVEQFLSGTAMGKRCTQAENPLEYFEGEVCSFLQPQVFRELAWFVTNLTYLLDPSIIVFGGSAGLALMPHMDKVRAELKTWMLPGTPVPELARAKVDDAGAVGAALLATT